MTFDYDGDHVYVSWVPWYPSGNNAFFCYLQLPPLPVKPQVIHPEWYLGAFK